MFALVCYFSDMATIHDVAKLAGVSTATVSRSFDDTSALSRQTRERVLEVAGRLDYRPRGANARRASRTGAQGRSPLRTTEPRISTTIGFEYFAYAPSDTLPTNGFYREVLAGAQAEASELGMHMLINTTHRHKSLGELPHMVRERAVAGMLLVGTADPPLLESFADYVPHIVLLDNRDSAGHYDGISSDGFGGANQATKHLLQLGHKRIGFLTSQVPDLVFKDRQNGYSCALLDAMGNVDGSYIYHVGKNEDTMSEALTAQEMREHIVQDIIAVLRQPHRPTAFLAANDDHAEQFMVACRRVGLSIPGDVSIIGFDDADRSVQLHPPLTTVRVDTAKMGRLAVRRLYSHLQNARASLAPLSGVNEEMPVTLILRESCGPPSP